MQMFTCSVALLLLIAMSSQAKVAPVPWAVGVSGGANGSAMITDGSLGAFGLGAGYQGSLFVRAPMSWMGLVPKLRAEWLTLRQEETQRASADFIMPGTLIKDMTQNWFAISIGVEHAYPKQGESFFWEALLGYAQGQPSTFTINQSGLNQIPQETTQATNSGLAVSGGLGMRKNLIGPLYGLATLRSFFLLASAYGAQPLQGRTFLPIPLIFDVGLEAQL